ncbi:transcription intermediary factor 1-alpha-like [Saccostrea echinata]|uniref:transcription intermediary factor 1-alpha-like n=1 Tax=Saccostrea echinata TaxID=191078 RepID=UPI002A83EC42|nr:transcription intermediary factor 1-alpha-like [Saccostrea echinata]
MTRTLLEDEKCDDILTCSICLEFFKEPKYLPCLHTFCKSCLQAYISTNVKEREPSSNPCENNDRCISLTERSFLCPVCRMKIEFNEEKDDRKTWIEHIPSNHFIVSMLDKRAIRIMEKICDPCLTQGEQEKAVAWCLNCTEALCEKCKDYHKKFKLLQNHRVVGLAEEVLDKYDVSGFIPCLEHPSEPARIYCKDHRIHCCTICAAVGHRKCVDVCSIENAAKGVKQNQETCKLINRISQLKAILREMISSGKGAKEELQKEASEVENVIKDFQENIKKHLDAVCFTLLNDLKSQLELCNLQIDSDVDGMSNVLLRVEQIGSVLQTCIDCGSDVECLIERKNVCEIEEKLQHSTKGFCNKTFVCALNFKPSQSFYALKTSLNSVGDLEVERREYGTLPSMYRSGEVSLLKLVRFEKKFGFCNAAFLNGNIIVIIIQYSSFIQFCDMELNELPDKVVELEDYPWDLSVDDNEGIYISLPKKQKIVRIDANTCQKTLEIRTLTTCQGVSYIWDTIFYSDRWRVRKKSGEEEIEIYPNSTKLLACDPINKKILFGTSHAVMCYMYSISEQKTKELYSDSELNVVRGITTDCVGNIYVVHDKSSCIFQLSHDGQFIRKINIPAVGVNKLWSINVEKKGTRCLLTNTEGAVLLLDISCHRNRLETEN